MTGNELDIDFSLANVWRSWYAFRKGKRNSPSMVQFEYYLERNLKLLHEDLISGKYEHGGYDHFLVHDTKPRDISVAKIRDRVVHRLAYDYMMRIWDKTFIYDVWSCRPDKGLHSGIERAQHFMYKYRNGWLWRSDVRKMFDSVDQSKMTELIQRRITDENAINLLDKIISSYTHNAVSQSVSQGLPIGNLTSQIMSNIYLNEFDRLMKNQLKPNAYMRYGDDWLCFANTKVELEEIRCNAVEFLEDKLYLQTNPKVDHFKKVEKGVKYLGVDIWPEGIRLDRSVQKRVTQRLNSRNVSSYRPLVQKYQKQKRLKELDVAIGRMED